METRKGRNHRKQRGVTWARGIENWLTVTFLCATVLGWWPAVVVGEPVRVTVLHTNNVKGHLFPCPS